MAFPPTHHPGSKVQPPILSHGTDTSFGNGRTQTGSMEGNHPFIATAANKINFFKKIKKPGGK